MSDAEAKELHKVIATNVSVLQIILSESVQCYSKLKPVSIKILASVISINSTPRLSAPWTTDRKGTVHIFNHRPPIFYVHVNWVLRNKVNLHVLQVLCVTNKLFIEVTRFC